MTLPIQKLTLYKHGISVVERGGAVTGESETLTFHRDQMNDVLKSLVALDTAGGQVRTIAYDAPEERDAKLARGSIHLSDEHSLTDLIRDLRGRQVDVFVDYKDGSRKVSGVVIGLDLPEERPYQQGRVTLRTQEGVEVLRLGDVQHINLQDEAAIADLDFFLKANVAQPDQRTVVLRLSEGEHNLLVRYVAPSPTWRVSYRLVGESDESDDRRALVQGWGIFDNPFDEPLEAVHIVLVSGMPISFIYDLYTPFTPQRPEVKEEARVAAAPIEMERRRSAKIRDLAAGGALAAPAPMMARAIMAADMAETESAAYSIDAMAQSTVVSSEAEAKGDLFEYRITHPVTVQRGEAAMVPILGTTLPYRKLYIYNGSKQPRHPAVVLRFNNESNLTLERGPITVIENNSYLGEAIFPFTRPGAEVLLAIAVDLGVTVTERSRSRRETNSIGIENQYLVFEQYLWTETTYEIANTNPDGLDLLIEHPREHEATLEEKSGTPEETTENFYRFKVEIPAGPVGVAKQKVSQRRLERRYEQLNSLTHENLQQYMKNRWVDVALADKLRELLQLYGQKQQVQQRINVIDQETRRLRDVQEQARKNMGGLKETGDEGKLRSRYVRQLNEAEDNLNALERERATRQNEINTLEQRIQAFIVSLQPQK